LIKQVAHLFFLSFTCINKPPSKSIGGNCLCVCVCIDIEKSKRENLFERNIESHTRPRGFHSKRDKLLTLIRGCLSLSFSFSFSLLYIPSIFRFKVLKKRKKEKENDLISAGGRMWPCRERHAIAKGPGHTHTHTQSFLAPLLLFMKIREPQGVHRSFITLFLISQSCCNEQKNK
jgi:hypothetical protein